MKKIQFKLEGKQMLTKEQMKNINGATGTCRWSSDNWSTYTELPVDDYFNCNETSEIGYDVCAGMMNNYGWTSCNYDCGCDGWGH